MARLAFHAIVISDVLHPHAMLLAKAALPTFIPHILYLLVGLVLIVAIEAWFVRRSLGLAYRATYVHVLRANLLSTLAGVPLAWVFFLLLPSVIVAVISMLLPSGTTGPGFGWRVWVEGTNYGAFTGVPIAWEIGPVRGAWSRLVSLVPFFLVTIWVEGLYLRKRVPAAEPRSLRRAVLWGNLTTYSAFVAISILAITSAYQELPERKRRFAEIREQQLREGEKVPFVEINGRREFFHPLLPTKPAQAK